MDENLLHHV
jgi:hypothetical protein